MEQEIENTACEVTAENETQTFVQDVIKEVFESFFGEERVDVQTFGGHNEIKVLIHYPELEITDSNDNKITVYDLFAMYLFDSEGKLIGGMKIKKTTFTPPQLSHRYIHSHTPTLGYEEWKVPCYGQGPIKNTIRSCNVEFDRDLLTKLCWETDIYLHTESTDSGPYIRLAIVNSEKGDDFYEACHDISTIPENVAESVVDYIIAHRLLKLTTYNGLVTIGENPYKIPLIIGDIIKSTAGCIGETERDTIVSNRMFLVKYTVNNGKLYLAGNPPTSYNISPVTFKGQDYNMKIIDDNNSETFLCASPSLTRAVIDKLLKRINCKLYERQRGITKENFRFQIEY